MTPASFWRTLMASIMDFVRGVYLNVYSPMISTIINTPILLLVFGILILGLIISIFKRMII